MSFVPSYYDTSKCGTLFAPNVDLAATMGREYGRANKIPPSSKSGQPKIIVSPIDVQIDFIDPVIGKLAVPGAVQDTDRLNRFIYNNVDKITHIVASLDTHYLFQCFHRLNWEAGENPVSHANGPLKGQPYQTGDNPDAFTLISLESVTNGAWRPVRHPTHMMQMLAELEQNSKKTLCIWPFHCLMGTPGHAFDPTFMEAMQFFSAARNDQYAATIKGVSPFSEHYGILRAEVPFSKDPTTQLNMKIVSSYEEADRVYLPGQAKSHCVMETLNQIVEIFMSSGRNYLMEKLYVLQDCMSSVPDIKDERGNVLVPFDDITNARFDELRKLGVKFVNSTDPIVI